MTQDPAHRSPSSTRRAARAGRNKPVLVTSTENEDNEQAVEETAPTLEESIAEVQAENPPVTNKARIPRKLPGFFSTVGKQTQVQTSETDAAQARIARATRAKGTSAKAPSSAVETKSTSTPKVEAKKEPARAAGSTGSGRATQTARPAGGFKTKYLIGMGIYLVVAEFMGTFVVNFFRANGLDTVLTKFNLFGGEITISTSILAFLAILVILLIALARFDLIPRSFTAMSANPPQRRTGNSSAKSNQNTTDGGRTTPPTMRQGVKGANDDLYQEYRANQRREKKR